MHSALCTLSVATGGTRVLNLVVAEFSIGISAHGSLWLKKSSVMPGSEVMPRILVISWMIGALGVFTPRASKCQSFFSFRPHHYHQLSFEASSIHPTQCNDRDCKYLVERAITPDKLTFHFLLLVYISYHNKGQKTKPNLKITKKGNCQASPNHTQRRNVGMGPDQAKGGQF